MGERVAVFKVIGCSEMVCTGISVHVSELSRKTWGPGVGRPSSFGGFPPNGEQSYLELCSDNSSPSSGCSFDVGRFFSAQICKKYGHKGHCVVIKQTLWFDFVHYQQPRDRADKQRYSQPSTLLC